MLRIEFEGVHNATLDNHSPDRRQQYRGPADTGKMRDMILWGDVHRILQVVINLISNVSHLTRLSEPLSSPLGALERNNV